MTTHTALPAASERQVGCIGCGALVSAVDGPTHRYIGASPGCWAVYGAVLAREYADPCYFAAHRLTADTYAAQHPGTPSRQAIQSVAVHLIALHVMLERSYDAVRATAAIGAALERRAAFVWLEPPVALARSATTILDVYAAADSTAHVERVRQWAGAVWEVWAPHHETVRRWAVPQVVLPQ